MNEWADPPLLPSWSLPDAPILPAPILEIPQGEIPSYKPLVVPPNTLRPPPGVLGIELKDEPPQGRQKQKSKKSKTKEQEQSDQANPTTEIQPVKQPDLPPEAQIVGIPFTDIEIPMPTPTIMTAAATTSVISVGATLAATSVFKYLVMVMKPILKQAWNKLTKKKNQEAS